MVSRSVGAIGSGSTGPRLLFIALIVTDDSGIVTGRSGDRDRCHECLVDTGRLALQAQVKVVAAQAG